MAIRLKRGGHRRLRRPRARRRRRRHLARQHATRAAPATCPSHLYSFSFAPNPELDAHLRAAAGDLALPARLRGALRRPAARPLRPRACIDARWDEDAQRWRLRDLAAASCTARRARLGAGPLSDAVDPRPAGPRALRGHDLPLGARGTTTTTSTASASPSIGTGASAIQFVPEIQPRVGRLHLFQRTPPWVMPRPDRAAHARRAAPVSRRCRRRSGSCARASTGRARAARARLRATRGSMQAGASALALRHLRAQVRDPELRAQAHARLPHRLQAHPVSNDYCPALAQPTSRSSPTASREVRAALDRRPPTAREREVDTIIFGTGFHVTDMPLADRIRGRDGRSLAEAWDGSPQAYLGTTVAGFPNLFFLVGPEHRPRPQLDRLHDRGAARLRARRPAHRWTRAAPARLEVRAGGPGGATTRDSRRSMSGTVWTDGRLRELVPRRAAAATRRCGRASPGPSAPARAGSIPRTTSCARRAPRVSPSPPEGPGQCDFAGRSPAGP